MSNLSNGPALSAAAPDPFIENTIRMCDAMFDTLAKPPLSQPDGHAECPGCTSETPAPHVPGCQLAPGAILAALDNPDKSGLVTRPFNFEAALRGEAFISRFDLRYPDAARRVTRTLRYAADDEHPAWMAWSGEWLVYADDDEGREEMKRDFRMVDGFGSYQRKRATCKNCGLPIVQMDARPDSSWTHTDARFVPCDGPTGYATPRPGTIVDPSAQGVR